MDHSLQADLDLLSAAALEAGQLAMTWFRKNPSAWAKAGGSPVTEADIAVDTFLRTELLRARPNFGWLSEETADDPARLQCGAVFVVDPIDGTRGFMAGDERWCVSIAIVREGRPVAAALHAPALGRHYTALSGRGAWVGETRLSISSWPGLRGAAIAGAASWLGSETWRRGGVRLQPHVPSLAYRFAQVADGSIDAAFASPRAHDWDLAACDLLVHEAGGQLTGMDGLPPIYNTVTLRHGALAAASRMLQPELLAALRKVAAERAKAGMPA